LGIALYDPGQRHRSLPDGAAPASRIVWRCGVQPDGRFPGWQHRPDNRGASPTSVRHRSPRYICHSDAALAGSWIRSWSSCASKLSAAESCWPPRSPPWP
jgi:hypothetical protein